MKKQPTNKISYAICQRVLSAERVIELLLEPPVRHISQSTANYNLHMTYPAASLACLFESHGVYSSTVSEMDQLLYMSASSAAYLRVQVHSCPYVSETSYLVSSRLDRTSGNPNHISMISPMGEIRFLVLSHLSRVSYPTNRMH